MKKHFFSLRERGLFLLLLGLFLSFSSYAQDITVKGVVKDSKFGDPIIGASVLVKGTTNGTISDMDGNFTLAAPKDGTLTISYIGYKSQEIPVNGQQNLNIILDEDVEALDEVVVVGYATGSKRTISGAVERIKKEDMNQGVVNTPLESLKGKVAGVVISKTGGDPASKPSIRVRGTTSLSGGNDPLVIIDGVFGDLSMLDAIAPADIETFTILKDASETAQYGSRGAAGVIVVTTVKGKNGMKTLSYNGNFGISNVYKNLKMLSADEFRSTAKALGMTPLDMGGNTNFFDEIEQLGYTQNHNISFGAGNDDSNYRASVGVIDQQGIIKNSGMKNYTAKLDASQNMFNNKLKIEFGMFGSLKQVDYTNDYEKTFYSAATYNPTFPTHKNEDGKWDEDPYANEIQNPLGRLEIQDREKNAYVNVHGKLTWTILDGLKLSAFGSYTYNVKENMKYIPKDLKAITQTSDAHGYRADNKQNILMGNIQLSYNKDLNEKHHIDALALVEGQKYHYTGFSAVALRLLDEWTYPEPESKVILAAGWTKAARRGWILEKAVEFEASGIWLWQAERSQFPVPSDIKESWQGQLAAGAKQCRNPWLPELRTMPGGVDELIALAEELGCEHRHVLVESGHKSVMSLTPDTLGQPGRTLCVVGPEGGFTAQEVEKLTRAGFLPATLGERVLRWETAAVLCLGLHWWKRQLGGK